MTACSARMNLKRRTLRDQQETAFLRSEGPALCGAERAVPVEILKEAIATGTHEPDPCGSSAIMYYTTIHKNGKKYNLEVLYNPDSNTVFHFKYTRKAIGPLPKIKK